MKQKEVWETQRDEKYKDHDLAFADIKPMELEMIRSLAINTITRTREFDAVKITIEEFMAFLAKRGYRITKVVK